MKWTLLSTVDDGRRKVSTYEHVMPHGRLIRVRTRYDPDGYERNYKITEAMAFVPNPPHVGGPFR